MINKSTSSKKFKSSSVISISIAHLVHDVYSSFLAPILPLLIEKLGISYSLVSLLSFIQKTPNIINPFIGLLADKIQMRFMVIFTPVVTAITMSLLGIATSYIMLAILLFIMGISASFFHVPAPVMIKKSSGNQLGKGMSFYMIGGEIARTLGPLIIVGAVSLWGLEGTWRLIPFSILASVILFFKLSKIKVSDDIRKIEKQTGIKETIKKHLSLLLILSAFIFFRSFMRQGLSLFLPTYFTQIKGESFELSGIIYAVFQFSGVFGVYFAGKLSDKLGRRTILLILAIITPIIMWLFLNLNGYFVIPFLILLGFFLIAQGPVLLAIINDVNSDRPAFINSIYMTTNFGINALVVIFVGVLSDLFSLEIMFKFSAIFALGAIPFVFMLPKKK
ncbi:MAG: MFS transporter [Bacteroidales bacterium]|nr:MFS transporter [Bacteroidales bacterium]